MINDKEGLLRIMKENYGTRNELVQSAMDCVHFDTLNIWSFYTVPKFPTWRSETRRVVIIRDAAHAIPPAVEEKLDSPTI